MLYPVALAAVMALAAPTMVHEGAPTCTGKDEGTGARAECRDFTIPINTSNVKDAADQCRALCCASSVANPVPLPGIPSAGCAAWYVDIKAPGKKPPPNGEYGTCYFCLGNRRNGVPPANASGCTGRSTPQTCMTGSIDATVSPAPPKPPSVIPHLGAEAGPDYVDAGHEFAHVPVYVNDTNTALNMSTEMTADGWPMMDCQITVFDKRPTHAWAPPMDDPEHRQEDLSGEWTIMLTGKADIELVAAVGITLGQPSYDEASNTMTQPMTFAKGGYPKVQNLLQLKFTNTRATPTSPPAVNGTGFRNLRILQPGYGPTSGKSTQLFTDNFAALMSIFTRLRWMGTTGTNGYTWRCGPPNAGACSVIQWSDRRTPDVGFFQSSAVPKGAIPWEHVLLAANEVNTDVWINVPVTASAPTVCRSDPNGDHTKCIDDPPESTYEYQLALLFKNGNNATGNVGLKPNLNIYIEHSNEVWNFGFKQEAINEAMAMWEVTNGTSKSNLDSKVPGRDDIDQRQQCSNKTEEGKGYAGAACWAKRRHARRVYEIAQTFSKVFGEGSLNTRIRPIYASWAGERNVQTYYNDTLAWLESEYGPIKDYIYAISYAQYFGPHSQNADKGNGPGFNYSTATIPEVIDAFNAAAVAGIPLTIDTVKLAKYHGVKTASYEGGPGYAVGGEKPGSKGLNTLIEASRDPGMLDAVTNHVDLVTQFGWDIYEYFTAHGQCSEYGCWGATESWKDLNPGPPKLQALYKLTGHHPDERAAWAADPNRPRAQDIRAKIKAAKWMPRV